jgi:hypothetical protein
LSRGITERQSTLPASATKFPLSGLIKLEAQQFFGAHATKAIVQTMSAERKEYHRHLKRCITELLDHI